MRNSLAAMLALLIILAMIIPGCFRPVLTIPDRFTFDVAGTQPAPMPQALPAGASALQRENHELRRRNAKLSHQVRVLKKKLDKVEDRLEDLLDD